jgi:anti-anti-sigma factor
VVVVQLDRQLRAPVKGVLRRAVAGLLRRGERRLVLDLARLDDIDAEGVGELVVAATAANAAGAELQIAHPNRRVRRLLEVAGVLGVLGGDSLDAPEAEMGAEILSVPACGPAVSGAFPGPARANTPQIVCRSTTRY